jgi:osmotically-inducible protein OsmY
MKHLLVATLLISLALPIACTRGNESTTQAAREPRMSNSDLKNRVEAQLNSDPQLRDSHISVSADADENKVTLSGTVPSETMRAKAVEMARSAHPGLTVEDKIDVRPDVNRDTYHDSDHRDTTTPNR